MQNQNLNSRGLARKNNPEEQEARYEAYRLALLAVGPVNNAEAATRYREVLRQHLGIIVPHTQSHENHNKNY